MRVLLMLVCFSVCFISSYGADYHEVFDDVAAWLESLNDDNTDPDEEALESFDDKAGKKSCRRYCRKKLKNKSCSDLVEIIKKPLLKAVVLVKCISCRYVECPNAPPMKIIGKDQQRFMMK